MGPVFIVGCSRSGTTLVQSVLAQTPGYVSFPETNILYHALEDLDYRRFGALIGPIGVLRGMIGRLYNHLGFTQGRVKQPFSRFLKNIGCEDLEYMIPRRPWRMESVFSAFRDILDIVADKCIWIEKTPQNIFCIDYIEKYIPDARFVHVIRNGPDTIASLVDAGRKYRDFSDRFGGSSGLNRAIAYWNSALLISADHKGKKNHIFIRYEDVVNNPAIAFNDVSKILGIKVLDNQFIYKTDGLTLKSEVWKKNRGRSIIKVENKFNSIFSEKGPCKLNCVTAHASLPCTGGYHEQNDERTRSGTA